MATNNYARHIKTKKTVFFNTAEGAPPTIPDTERQMWALWRRPPDHEFKMFRMVGEDKDEYCISNAHGPACCVYCKREPNLGVN